MPLTIACDVDGTIADLHTSWLNLYNADYNDTLTPEDIHAWNMANCVKPECGNKIFDYLNCPSLYDNVLPIEGALGAVTALREAGHRVVFVTSSNAAQAGRKLTWLIDNGFLPNAHTFPDYIVANDKSLIRADMIIDDGVHNLRQFQVKHSHYRILFTQPHNLSENGTGLFVRFSTWPAITNYIESLQKGGSNDSPSVLESAQSLVHGDRAATYGHPSLDYTCNGRIWAALITHWLMSHHPGALNMPIPDIPAHIGCLLMVGVKQTRAVKSPDHRDNWVDGAGYFECGNMCVEHT